MVFLLLGILHGSVGAGHFNVQSMLQEHERS